MRRVATLVARGTSPERVFAAATEEVVRVIPVDFARMGRYDTNGTVTFVAAAGQTSAVFAVGVPLNLEGKNVSTALAQTGGAARVDNYVDASGPIGVAFQKSGFRSAVGTPITVEGHLWGVMVVGSASEERMPADTEKRLAEFTELLAMAIANAESRARIARLAEEQTALRRVATLVARGTPPEEVFAAVIDEVAQLFPVDYAGMARYEPDHRATSVAAWGTTHFPVGVSRTMGGRNTATIVFETGQPARIDGYDDASGPMGDPARERGVSSSVGAPIIVEGRLWGIVGAGSTGEQPLPQDTEARLADFTELVATAIANGESRAQLAQLAEQQAALRRVATLVARGVPPEEVFAAVIDEVMRLFPVEFASLARYESDNTITSFAARGVTSFVPGRKRILGGKNTATLVFETGRPARIDGYADASGPLGDNARERGVSSSVATPIFVAGRLWGAIGAGSTGEQQLPPDTGARLADFTELAATAIANAESRAALAASRARIMAAADESRRKIERDLHDGAQQRLVHAVIVLKLALEALSSGNAEAGELVAEALHHAEQANAELRELAHGILPAALTRGGLQAGVEGLVSRMSLPVSVEMAVERLLAVVEATAYFVVSEALTNVVKHAHATSAGVTAQVAAGKLRVEVRDNGVGGACGTETSGLGGLEDRVSALGGDLVLESPPGGGTRVCALLPVSQPG